MDGSPAGATSPTCAIGRATVLTANPAETELADSLSSNQSEGEAVNTVVIMEKELSKYL
jgi:hypothetical protein